MFSVTVFTALFSSGYQQRTGPSTGFPNCPRPQLLAATHFRLSRNGSWSLVWTAQETQLPAALLLLCACLLRPSRDGSWAIVSQRVYLQSHSLPTAVTAGFTILAFSRHTTILIKYRYIIYHTQSSYKHSFFSEIGFLMKSLLIKLNIDINIIQDFHWNAVLLI
jgi:hypothetical protein